MRARREERELEVEMVGREHPFVVLSHYQTAVTISSYGTVHVLTMDIDSENVYLEGSAGRVRCWWV